MQRVARFESSVAVVVRIAPRLCTTVAAIPPTQFNPDVAMMVVGRRNAGTQVARRLPIRGERIRRRVVRTLEVPLAKGFTNELEDGRAVNRETSVASGNSKIGSRNDEQSKDATRALAMRNRTAPHGGEFGRGAR